MVWLYVVLDHRLRRYRFGISDLNHDHDFIAISNYREHAHPAGSGSSKSLFLHFDPPTGALIRRAKAQFFHKPNTTPQMAAKRQQTRRQIRKGKLRTDN
jgi:hypothetical protein